MKNILTLLQTLLGEVRFGQLPVNPDNVTLINILGGNSPQFEVGSMQPLLREPTFQIMVRDLDYVSGLNKIDGYLEILHTHHGVLDSTWNISRFSQISDVIVLGRDEKNRYMFSVNMVIYLNRR